MKVVVVDVHEPRIPKITDELLLDGYGDGVAVYDGHLYAATGLHSRAKPQEKPGDPGYGNGHGLEISTPSNPAHPSLISRTKFPREDHTRTAPCGRCASPMAMPLSPTITTDYLC
jgi:hypothetical protein